MHLTPRLYNDKDLSSHQACQTVLSEQSRLFIYLFFFGFVSSFLFVFVIGKELQKFWWTQQASHDCPRGLSATHEWFIFQLLCKCVRVAAEDTRRRKCLRYNVGVGDSGGFMGKHKQQPRLHKWKILTVFVLLNAVLWKQAKTQMEERRFSSMRFLLPIMTVGSRVSQSHPSSPQMLFADCCRLDEWTVP